MVRQHSLITLVFLPFEYDTLEMSKERITLTEVSSNILRVHHPTLSALMCVSDAGWAPSGYGYVIASVQRPAR